MSHLDLHTWSSLLRLVLTRESGSIAINNLHPSSSLGYTNYLYVQKNDYTIHGYNISWAAENTAFSQRKDGSVDTFVIDTQGSTGIPGTHLSVTTLQPKSGGSNLLAFYQTVGNDISYYSRDFLGGVWTGNGVPIPDT